MDPYRTPRGGLGNSRQRQMLDAVVPYRYYAPAKLALDEAREQMLAETALYHLMNASRPTAGRSQLTQRVRHRLGGILILIGTHLQGTGTRMTTAPASGLKPTAV